MVCVSVCVRDRDVKNVITYYNYNYVLTPHKKYNYLLMYMIIVINKIMI